MFNYKIRSQNTSHALTASFRHLEVGVKIKIAGSSVFTRFHCSKEEVLLMLTGPLMTQSIKDANSFPPIDHRHRDSTWRRVILIYHAWWYRGLVIILDLSGRRWGISIAPRPLWIAMTTVSYRNLICILLTDNVISGSVRICKDFIHRTVAPDEDTWSEGRNVGSWTVTL